MTALMPRLLIAALLTAVLWAVMAKDGTAAASAQGAAYKPNPTPAVAAAVAVLDTLNPFLRTIEVSKGKRWVCKMIDDAPTKKSLKRTAVIYYCVPEKVKASA